MYKPQKYQTNSAIKFLMILVSSFYSEYFDYVLLKLDFGNI